MRRILAAVLLATFSVAIAFVAIEVGVRSLHLVPASFFEPDPVLGTRLIPGQRGWWTQEELEFRTPVRINREGFRDIDHEREKPAGVTRILVLGASAERARIGEAAQLWAHTRFSLTRQVEEMSAIYEAAVAG